MGIIDWGSEVPANRHRIGAHGDRFERVYIDAHRRGHEPRARPAEIMIGNNGYTTEEIFKEPDAPLPNAQYEDAYGRELPPKVRYRGRKEFQQTLPENPFRVRLTEYSSKPNKDLPDQPLLQFWTFGTTLRIVNATNPVAGLGLGLRRYDITDATGDWCGSIVLDKDWVAKQEASTKQSINGSTHEFIAISDAKAFTMEECNTWTYYIPKEREQSEWDLYYVLLIETRRKENDPISRRVALGKVFQAAFENSPISMDEQWKEIILG